MYRFLFSPLSFFLFFSRMMINVCFGLQREYFNIQCSLIFPGKLLQGLEWREIGIKGLISVGVRELMKASTSERRKATQTL